MIQTGIIITDCHDDNARVRQQARFMGLFGLNPAFLAVHAPTHNLEAAGVQAAGHLIDQLDAATSLPHGRERSKTVILMNVATRGSHVKKKWANGTPFCFFWLDDHTLVASTYDGPALSLARDLGLVREVQLMDIPTVVHAAVQWGELTPEHAERIIHTQFRSLEFLPLAARWVYEGREVPAETRSLYELPDVSGQIYFIDNFGNAKTTILPETIGFQEGKRITLEGDIEATCYERLADVPDGEVALTIGSSGYRDKRFVELVVQRRSAAEQLGLAVGQLVKPRVSVQAQH